MSLNVLCRQLSCSKENLLDAYDPIGPRLVCPEYSPEVKEVKTYPPGEKAPLFALCWHIEPKPLLHATIVPASRPFSYQYPFTPNSRTQMHTHEYLELSYIVAGTFRQKILGREITFQKGDLCLIDKNCLHQDYLENQKATILFLGISNQMFEDIMYRRIDAEGIGSFLHTALLKQKDLQQYLHFRPHPDASALMEDSMHMLLKELVTNDDASATICAGLLLRIFSSLSTEYDFFLSKELRKEMKWILFEEITDYMNTHLSDISISRLTSHFHFQEDYFNRLLKAKTGLTYTQYLQKLRLEKAEELLKTTALSIDQIAESVGYRNKGYFYKIFTARHRLTPAQFRKKLLH